MTQFGGKQLVLGGSGLATAARNKGVDSRSAEGVSFMRDLLEKGKFAIGNEGQAEELTLPREIEREVVSGLSLAGPVDRSMLIRKVQ
jgi:hypothetical protein